MPYTLEARSNALVFRRAVLAERRMIAPDYVRVRLAGDELRGFDSAGADDHIRLFVPPRDRVNSTPSVDELRTWPSREYTPLHWNPIDGTLDLEFAVHGTEGVAAPWARDAPIGSPIAVGGPRGSKVIVGDPQGWLLAGDETAVPAITRWLETATDAATRVAASGSVLIEVPDAARELPLDVPTGFTLEFVHRADRPAGAALLERLNTLGAVDRPAAADDTFVFVAAEQSIVRAGRALLARWSIDPARAVVKGYWKRGTDEYHAPH